VESQISERKNVEVENKHLYVRHPSLPIISHIYTLVDIFYIGFNPSPRQLGDHIFQDLQIDYDINKFDMSCLTDNYPGDLAPETVMVGVNP
jgi:hypothetical protein